MRFRVQGYDSHKYTIIGEKKSFYIFRVFTPRGSLSLQTSKENIQYFKNRFFSFFLWVIFAHLDPHPHDQNQCGSGSATLPTILNYRVWYIWIDPTPHPTLNSLSIGRVMHTACFPLHYVNVIPPPVPDILLRGCSNHQRMSSGEWWGGG